MFHAYGCSYIYVDVNKCISAQKTVAPQPGLKPWISCVPGRRANHCTTAGFRFCTPTISSINLSLICAILGKWRKSEFWTRGTEC